MKEDHDQKAREKTEAVLPHRLLIVKWIDTRAYDSSTSRPPADMKILKPLHICSVGWGYQGSEGMILSMDYDPEDEERRVYEGYRNIIVIPFGSIKEMQEVTQTVSLHFEEVVKT